MNIELRTRIFLGVMISLLLLAIIPLASCTPDPTFEYSYCQMVATAQEVPLWVDMQDEMTLDYRGDLNAWIGTDLQGVPHTLGYALTEDSNIWVRPECMVLDLR